MKSTAAAVLLLAAGASALAPLPRAQSVPRPALARTAAPTMLGLPWAKAAAPATATVAATGLASTLAGPLALPACTAIATVPCALAMIRQAYVFSLSYSADGETLAVVLGDGTLELRDAGCGDLLASADAHHSAASQVRFLGRATAGGAVPLVSAGDDRRLRLWTTHGAVAGFELGSGAAKRRKARRRVSRGADAELRAAAEVELDEKINWVAVADAQADAGGGGGGALACVADTGDAVRLFAVEC